MVQLLGMLLDFLDALAGAVAIACWWCTWVRPAKPPPLPPSEPAEIDWFVHAARSAGARGGATPLQADTARSDEVCDTGLSAKPPLPG